MILASAITLTEIGFPDGQAITYDLERTVFNGKFAQSNAIEAVS
ncbi:hypothetical protein GCM10011609_85150 [Lentzea pudingi]|uniref:GntR family transcriptional regulator n=1 Tax=Lentzea pudingi TaxID=1789439 RepID=A0ABQ2ITJ3_9PSEU|nr:hypothetical protein [Lentzea pudingi]GGN28733.1 hypothetical protein GCM10011609_85150 [Lentzea pudingi]